MILTFVHSGTVVIDGKTYLDRMNYQILNDKVLETKIKESKFSYTLLVDSGDDSRRFKNLFDVTSMMVMDELPEIDFYIISVKKNPKSMEFFNIPKSDIPAYRFYSFHNEIPYTEHFWNKYRMADYFRQRVLNKVKVLESREEVQSAILQDDSFIYFHNDSSSDYNNTNLQNLDSMACLYHKLNVFLVKDEGLFEFAKTLYPLKDNPNLKNKAHMIVYHSPHTGINMVGFNTDNFEFQEMRNFYKEHRFALILDYNLDVHDFLFVENMSAIFLVVKEIPYRSRHHSLDWGRHINKRQPVRSGKEQEVL
jgi:hypothetical protein